MTKSSPLASDLQLKLSKQGCWWSLSKGVNMVLAIYMDSSEKPK
jgi:hypothetical protein